MIFSKHKGGLNFEYKLVIQGGQVQVWAMDSPYNYRIAVQESYAKIGDWELRISLHSLVETCQDVNKHKEYQLIIHTPVTNLHL